MVSRERVAKEFALLALSNVQDFIDLDERGQLIGLDVTRASRDQLAAVKSIEVHTYVDRSQADKPTVKRVKLTLYEKVPALVTFAKMMGWLTEDEDTVSIEQRLRAMTPEQRRADARALLERARQVLADNRGSPVDDEAGEAPAGYQEAPGKHPA